MIQNSLNLKIMDPYNPTSVLIKKVGRLEFAINMNFRNNKDEFGGLQSSIVLDVASTFRYSLP